MKGWIILIILFLLACVIGIIWAGCEKPVEYTSHYPIEITDSKINDDCEIWFLAWTTNVETQCTVSFCTENFCWTTEPSPWGKLHTIVLPEDVITYEITAIDREGHTATFQTVY